MKSQTNAVTTSMSQSFVVDMQSLGEYGVIVSQQLSLSHEMKGGKRYDSFSYNVLKTASIIYLLKTVSLQDILVVR